MAERRAGSRRCCSFVRREADILVATTIIESGLDIPNANTIFINQADNYGLADLHQLRGRVGRYKHRAYAYLLLDSERAGDADGGAAAQGDRGVHRAGRRLQDRHARPGDPRRRQHPRHAAERPHRRRRLRDVLPAAGKRRAHAQEPAAAHAAGSDTSICRGRRICRATTCRDSGCASRCIAGWRGCAGSIGWTISARSCATASGRCRSRPSGCCVWRSCACWRRSGRSRRSIWRNPPRSAAVPTDVVLGYRNPRRMQELAARSNGRVRIVDDASAYFRPTGEELEPLALYATLKKLLRPPADD